MRSIAKFKMLFLIIMLVSPVVVSAQRGCCSHHGGVAGCNADGRQICNDGTLSPSCTCTPTVTYVYGCTDSSAKNYNSKANKDNGSCEYYTYGCTDPDAKNYNRRAEKDDDSCEYYVYGCMDSEAANYDETAEKDDNSCEYKKVVEETSNEKSSEETNNEIKDELTEDSTDESDDFLSVLTIGGVGAGIYYFKKRKQKN